MPPRRLQRDASGLLSTATQSGAGVKDAPRVAVLDGPYDAAALKTVFARPPVTIGLGLCDKLRQDACQHGTFILGLLGAAESAPIPGLCPECEILHIPLFKNGDVAETSVADLAHGIITAVRAGAKLINLSLAILDADGHHDRALQNALDDAQARGAVVVAAAGNQGQLANGQLLSHSATIPVVAVDARGEPLRSCNFGPAIARSGVAAPGDAIPGYAPGGGTTKMSGTSVATAVATGVLAKVWAARPRTSGTELRAAVARLGRRDGLAPPLLNTETLLSALEGNNSQRVTGIARRDGGYRPNHARRQGDLIMSDETTVRSNFDRRFRATAPAGAIVTPAQMPGGCGCGGAAAPVHATMDRAIPLAPMPAPRGRALFMCWAQLMFALQINPSRTNCCALPIRYISNKEKGPPAAKQMMFYYPSD